MRQPLAVAEALISSGDEEETRVAATVCEGMMGTGFARRLEPLFLFLTLFPTTRASTPTFYGFAINALLHSTASLFDANLFSSFFLPVIVPTRHARQTFSLSLTRRWHESRTRDEETKNKIM